MNAVETILKKADMIMLLEHYEFEKISINGNIARACCKIHGGNNPSGFVVDLDTTLYFCHTGDCGGGDVFTLVEKMEKLPFSQAVGWLSTFFDVNIDGLEIKERKSQLKKELNSFISIMKSRRKSKSKVYTIKADVKSVKEFRNFNKDTIKNFNLGFAKSIELERRDETTYNLQNRLIFPIEFNKELIGIALRRTKSSDVPKWSNQPVNIDTGAILYNYDRVQLQDTITVVEGITDVWAYHEIGVASVATFGAHLTKEQYGLLIKSGANIVLSYDGDDAGRIATTKAISMLKNKANIYVVSLPQGSDPESIEREELLKIYEQRRRV